MEQATTHSGETMQHISLSQIRIEEGFNPRTYFDPDALHELADSIKKQGVIQPVVVRPDPNATDAFVLIAGERRYRASKIAGIDSIPSVIRDTDENTARILAVTENVERDDMSPIEEAQAARKIIDAMNGDQDEAAKKLGWSVQKVKARLLLLHCADAVQNALAERKILLGHAELLSSLPEKTQSGTLDKILAESWSVAFLKDKISAFTANRSLNDAVFDTTGCQGCEHNTSDQAELFASHVSAGRCSLAECWNTKVKEWLEQRRVALAEDYPQIYLDTEKDPSTWVVLVTTGDKGVGQEQYQSCKACGDYGAIMSSQPGKEGQILQEDACFNKACHRQKVAAYQEVLGVKPTQSDKPASASHSASGSASKKKTAKKKDAAAPHGNPKKVQTYVDGVYRETAGKVVVTSPTLIRCYALLALKREAEARTNDEIRALEKQHKIDKFSLHSDRAKLIDALFKLDDDALDTLEKAYVQAIAAIQASSMGAEDQYLDGAKQTLRCLDTNLAEHFTVDKAFLELHTKGGIMELLRHAVNGKSESFVDFYNAQHDEKAFAKLEKEKVGDLIQKVIDSGFDFTGYVPASVALK